MAQNKKLHSAKRILSAITAALVATSTLTAVPAMAEDEILSAIDDTESEYILADADGATSAEWSGSPAVSFGGGSGTQASPYLISTGGQLAYLANKVDEGNTYSGTYFKLTVDILLNSEDRLYDDPKAWNPIGSSEYAFEGTFDGNGHEVIGMYISTSEYYQGLFATNKGTIKNLSVTDGEMTCSGANVGAVCGWSDGDIIDCKSDVNITCNGGSVDMNYGGICGTNTGTVEGCTNDGKLSASVSRAVIGGICGVNSGTINDCHNNGIVYATNCDYVGGINGLNRSTIRACANTAAVDGYSYVGGICGRNDKAIRTSFNTGTVTIRRSYGGGICGLSQRSDSIADILDCHNSGYVDGALLYIGGICGYFNGYLIKDSYNTGTVYANWDEVYYSSYPDFYAGGICGWANKGSVSSCYNAGFIAAFHDNSKYYQDTHSGGIAGYMNSNVNISDCYNKGTATASNNTGRNCYSYIGGIYGYSASSGNSVSNCISYLSGIYGGGSATRTNVYSTSTPSEKYTSDDIVETLGFDPDIWEKTPNSGLNRYYINLKGIDADDDWHYVSDTLIAPANVKATVASGIPTISWSAAQGATSYRVYRATSSSGTKTLLKATSATSYTDNTTEHGKTYYYYVAAYNSTNDILSGYSSVTVTIPAAPAAPTISSVTQAKGKITIAWKAVSNATSYKVYRATSATGTKTLLKSVGITYCEDTTATFGQTYYYFVQAYNSNAGAASAYSSAQSIKFTSLAPPTLNSVTTDGSKVTLSWSAVPNATSYRVYRGTSATAAKTLLKTVSTTSCNNTSVTAGTTYYYYVVAYSSKTDTMSAASNTKSVTMTGSSLSAPTISSVTQAKGQINISWNAVDGATSYKVYRATSATGTKTLLKTVGITSCTDATATLGTTYYYFVQAYSSKTATTSAYSGYKSLKFTSIAPPTLNSVTKSNNVVTLSWTAVPGATSYRVYRGTSATGAKSLLKTVGITSCNNTSVTAGTTYYYYVVAYSSKTDTMSAASNTKSITV